jgi:histidine triad (HIT) family protein
VISHAPDGYRCPFCRNINEGGAEHPLEMIHVYDEVVVKLNPKWWRANRGALLVVPKRHYENIYDLPTELGTPIQTAVRDAALALKAAFKCDGVSTRQHNEPAGYQDVWHYHVHVFPRYEGDDLYASRDVYWPDAAEMRTVADEVRAAWPS